jgi:type IV secretion system protein TrbB
MFDGVVVELASGEATSREVTPTGLAPTGVAPTGVAPIGLAPREVGWTEAASTEVASTEAASTDVAPAEAAGTKAISTGISPGIGANVTATAGCPAIAAAVSTSSTSNAPNFAGPGLLAKETKRTGPSDMRCVETRLRRRAMLRTAMGAAIAQALEDDDVVEVLVNPDGRLWLDRHGIGRCKTPIVLAPVEAERIIRLVASHVRAEASAERPIVSAELPDTGERFEGLLPPVTSAPSFAIRKPTNRIIRLCDYVATGAMNVAQARYLSEAVKDAKNILIAGGTGSGKTTLVNALLAEIANLDQRVILIEDMRELLCAAQDCLALRTKPGIVNLSDLVRSTMRLRPDRIIVGEVRGGEALDMLKAWNTGHPGGVATLHANSARAALYRLEQLIQEVVTTVPRRLIAEAVDMIVFITGRGLMRRIESIALVTGLSENGDYRVETLSGSRP